MRYFASPLLFNVYMIDSLRDRISTILRTRMAMTIRLLMKVQMVVTMRPGTGWTRAANVRDAD